MPKRKQRTKVEQVSMFNDGMKSSETPEWYTPERMLVPARQLLGTFDLDPASSREAQQAVQATEWYGLDHSDETRRDGLAHAWHGRVWMNPPYGDAIKGWIQHLIQQFEQGRCEALALLPARTDTLWLNPVLGRYPVCFVKGRLRFSGHTNSAPFPSIVVYFGPVARWQDFKAVFALLGPILVPMEMAHMYTVRSDRLRAA